MSQRATMAPVGSTRLAAAALVRCALRGQGMRAGPHLIIVRPGGVDQAVALPAELTVGRGPQAGLVLDDPGASRVHARIRLEEDGAARVEDLGSKNGLRLNGRRLPAGPTPLRPGDELAIGATRLRFVDPLAAATSAAVGGEALAAADPPGGPASAAAGGPTDGRSVPARLAAGSAAPPGWLLDAAGAALLAAAALLLALD